MTCKVPYYDVKNNNAVLGHIARGKKPEPPKGSQVAPVHWEFIQRCWLPRASRPLIEEIVLFAHQQYCELHPNDAAVDEKSFGSPPGILYGTWSRHWSGYWSDTENDESDESDDDSSSGTDQDAEGEGLDKDRDNREDDGGEEGQQSSEGEEHDQSSDEDDDDEGEGVDRHGDHNEVISLDGGDGVEGDEDLEDDVDYASYDNDGDDGDWVYDSNESW